MNNETNIKLPKKYYTMIDEMYKDEDGYWVYTSKGYYAAGMDKDCHTIHEDRQTELLQQIRRIEPCDCDDCTR